METLKSQTLHNVVQSQGIAGDVDVLVVDIQGAELLVLKSGTQTLQDTQAVVCEVSTERFYSGGVLYPELQTFFLKAMASQPPPSRIGRVAFCYLNVVPLKPWPHLLGLVDVN